MSRVPPGARVRLLRNLLDLELEYRLRIGEQPDEHSYRERFPEFGEGPVRLVPAGPGTPGSQGEAVPPSRGGASGR